MNEMQSIRIDGSGKIGGGIYDEVRINGNATVIDNFTCNLLRVSGMASLEGDVTSKETKISGTAKQTGELVANILDVSGTYKTIGGINADRVIVRGSLKAEGSMKANHVDVSGFVTVKQDINSEVIETEGNITCEGCINSEHFHLRLAGTSTIGEIGGSEIIVENRHLSVGNFISSFLPGKLRSNQLIVKEIEGDEIRLENTTAEIVRGNNVKIGPNCKIGLIEYSGMLEIDEESVVDNKVQV